MGTFRLKRGQVVEIIPDEDPLNVSRCHVIWVGTPGSKHEGQVGLQILNPAVNPRARNPFSNTRMNANEPLFP
jgi:hypothetical protein